MDENPEPEAVADGIEIPEPDYDSCPSEDEQVGVASDVAEQVGTGVATVDVEPTSSPLPLEQQQTPLEQQQKPLEQQQKPLSTQACDSELEDESRTYNFEQVRAQLEAFSRDEQLVLAGSLARDLDIPEPDYSDSDEDRDLSAVGNEGVDEAATSSKKIDDLGVQTSKEQQAVMRELLRNQKLGVSVFSKKSELDKELEKRKLRQQRREEEEIQRQKRSSFELRMEEQAKKLLEAEQQQQQQQQAVSDCADDQPEFLKVHSKINKVKSAS